jgi:hypothetical protein
MICLEERPDCYVFACQTCKDVLGVVAAQVKIKAGLKAKVRNELAARGHLLKAPPPKIKRTRMDQSLVRGQKPVRKSYFVFGGKK